MYYLAVPGFEHHRPGVVLWFSVARFAFHLDPRPGACVCDSFSFHCHAAFLNECATVCLPFLLPGSLSTAPVCLLLGITLVCTFLCVSPSCKLEVEFLPCLSLPGYAKLYLNVVVLIYPSSHQQYRALFSDHLCDGNLNHKSVMVALWLQLLRVSFLFLQLLSAQERDTWFFVQVAFGGEEKWIRFISAWLIFWGSILGSPNFTGGKVFFDLPPWVGSGLCPCALWSFESWVTGLPWFCRCPQGKISVFTCLSGFLSLFRFWSKWCSLGSC